MKPVSTADPNLVILTGENPFIRLADTDTDTDDYTTNASFWRIKRYGRRIAIRTNGDSTPRSTCLPTMRSACRARWQLR
jgi:hypothetical protein